MPPDPSTEEREREVPAGRPSRGAGLAASEMLPRWIPVYKLIRREHYRPAGAPRAPR